MKFLGTEVDRSRGAEDLTLRACHLKTSHRKDMSAELLQVISSEVKHPTSLPTPLREGGLPPPSPESRSRQALAASP